MLRIFAGGRFGMSRVTLRTIAEDTGLSKFAVSRALAGKGGVSEETRARVQAAAERLGYLRAAAPAKGRPLGLIFSDADLVNSELHMCIQGGAQREAERLGFDVRVHWTHAPDDLVNIARLCAGVLVCGPHDPAALAQVHASGVPMVRQGWLSPLESIDYIGGTDHESGCAVGEYLTRLGHRELAYVHGEAHYRGRRERLNGLREVVEATPGASLHDLVWEAPASFHQVHGALLATGARPTAYFCAHDGIAVTVISDLLGRGLQIPRDASVIGFGGFSVAEQVAPRLTTVRVHGAEIGAMSVRLLDSRLNAPGFPRSALRIYVPNSLVERQSSGPPPAGR